MLVYVPLWLESSYLEIFPKKRVCYGAYEELLQEEDHQVVFIKNILTNFDVYASMPHIIVIFNSLKKDLEEITNKYLVDLSDGRFQISFKIR